MPTNDLVGYTSGPIAIVGAGLRLPGGVRSLDGYWELLCAGRDAISDVPPDRWDADLWTDPDPDAPGKMRTRSAGFLDELATFDAAFFGISPREALELDPAQRLLLEVAWEALESAAIAPDRLERSATGVYVGLGLSDYGRRHFLGSDPSRMTAYSGTGSFLSVAAGRISYTLGLQGPAMTVDTACSSSLVAVHLAIDALRRGEIDLALAGGANVLCAPEPSVYFSKLNATSPDGRCKTFDAAADGYGRGEGAGIVALKRLADAVAAGDPIVAVIRGSAVNQDGRSNGLTAPNGAAQQAVVRLALANAGVAPADVGYIEAHGTGTPLGDPIEVDALAAVFGGQRPGGKLRLGSAKTNFGHLETAAGIAGLLKVALCVQRGAIPPHLHLNTLNPRIRLGDALEIPTTTAPWTADARIGGVSSFGLSGTNAHVVLERAPNPSTDAAEASTAIPVIPVIPLSARSEAAVAALAAAWAEVAGEIPVADLARTAIEGRATLPVRLAIAARDDAHAKELLSAAARGEDAPGVVRGLVKGSRPPGVAFLFTGQGAQHVGMGEALYAAEPVFRDALDACFQALDPLLAAAGQPRALRDVMWGAGGSDGVGLGLDDTQYTQPALFALEVALARWWAALGVEPDALIGHSIGEIAAAHVAGVLSLADAAKLVVERARLMQALPRDGAMAAIFAPEAQVREAIAPYAATVDVSGVNGPTETVVSGAAADVAAITAGFEARGVKVRALTVSHAFHSPRMDAMLDAFEAFARTLAYAPAEIPVVSNVDGADAGDRLQDPRYWREHVRRAVRFSDGLETLFDDGISVFVEVGPRPVLSGIGARCANGRPAAFVATLHPERDDREQVAIAVASLWAHGVPVALASRTDGRRRALPTMPWQGERYWLDAPDPSPARDPLMGDVLEVAWRPAPAPRVPTTGRWVVVGDSGLTEALSARGADAVETWSEGDTPDHVVFVAGRGTAEDESWDAAIWAQRAAGARARLHLVAHTDERPASASLRGLGRVVANESPDRWGGFVDVVGAGTGPRDPELVENLVDALLAADGEDVVQVSATGRRAARLARSRAAFLGAPLEVPAEGAILVTGGFGGVGRAIARRLVDWGARHLVLVGRSGGAGPDAAAFVAELEARGVKVEARKCDVGSKRSLKATLAKIGDLVGVVHAAGTTDDGLLRDQTRERFAGVVGAKADGALLLDELTADRDLKLFVLVSSASGWVGVPGQASYAAANAVLDAVATQRRARGQAAVSFAFGPLSGTGIARDVSADLEARWAREGIHALDPAVALAAIHRTAAGARAALIVAPFAWDTWRSSRPFPTHLADELADEILGERAAADPARPAPTAVATATPLVDQLRAAPEQARRAMVVDHVQQQASRVLGFGAGKRIGQRDGFFDAGMDSLMAVELRERLQRDLGQALSATVAFDHPTVDALSDAVLAALGLGAGAAIVVSAVPVDLREPIAIVGAACRMPGHVSTLDGLWAVHLGAVDAIDEVPAARFDVNRYFDPTPGTPGKLYSRWGGFVDDIEQFEPGFFGISPREAMSLDPQQRLLLECAWHALEDAATPADSLRDTRTGVYVGIGSSSEYWHRFDPTIDEVDAYAGTGNETSFAAGRVSYVLGLQGPSMSVNTACSSSLVSVHMAIDALRRGQCDVAVAGGVNAIVGPETTIWMSMLQALAPDGRCKAFDARADGYVRSEGCGMVVLKRLSDAVRDGDRVRAVIRGSAVNHDGASSGLTVPNGLAQQAVIRDALADAGVDAASIGLVECHGTGTRLGDPIEVSALGAVLARGRAADRPLFLGAAKANHGHLEAGAGIAGLLRAMLAIEHGVVPPIAHLGQPNPALPLGEFPAVKLPTSPVPWTADGPRRAGVSSFGISGTNAHVVLEQAPSSVPAPSVGATRPAALIAVSGRTEAGARALAAALSDAAARGDVGLADLAVGANTGRAHLQRRASVVASTAEEAVAGLRKLASGIGAVDAAGDPPRVVFLCTGAGPQAHGMAKALADADPVFRDALHAAAAAADPVLDRPLLDVIYEDAPADRADSALHDLAYTQPAMFAIEWATAALWRSFGVEPAAVIGHSTGQYVAACLAGVFDLPTGMRLMAERARMMSGEPKIGEMVACFAPEATIARYLAGHERDATLAAVNGPAEAVISGRSEVVNALADQIERDGIEIRRLNISHAAHSPLMEPILDGFERLVGSVSLHAPRLPLIENVRGAIAGAEVTTAAYWREHMREPVRFYAGMRTLVDGGYRVFVELGNHPVLAGAGARCVEDAPDAVFLPSMRRDRPDWEQLLDTAGALYRLGARLDWAGFHRHAPGRRIALPPTPFQRKKYWVDRKDRASTKVVGEAWTYAPAWQPVRPNVDPFGSRGDKAIVVFADDAGVGAALAGRQQRRAVVVRPGTRFAADGDAYVIDPGDPAHYDRVLAEVQPQHIVHLWSLDAAEPAPTGSATASALPAAMSALRALAAAAKITPSPTVYLVTRGATAAGGTAPALSQAPVLGLGNTAAIELDALPVVRVDLDPADPDPALQLEVVLNTGAREDQLAIRGGKHFARRLGRVSATGSPAPVIRGDATYLVTGGLGALGLRVARWLVDQGAGAVVLTSRRERAAANAELEALGGKVTALLGDVADRAALDAILGQAAARGLPPVVGVFHAAGVLDDDWLRNLDEARVAAVLRPKLDGAWNLHQALPDAELFALFSSAASLLGNPGQGSYAAANAFLDALAESRRAAGRHAVSLCWGPWADGGLATEVNRQWDRGGVRPMPPSLAIAVLAQRLGGPEPVVGVVDLDWKRWPAAIPRVPALVAGLVERAEPDEVATRKVSGLDVLRGVPGHRRRDALADVVAGEVGGILGLEPGEVDRRVGFFDSGMDSLMAVELAKRLRARLASALPATVAFDHPTVDVLTDWLFDHLDLRADADAAVAPAASPALAAAGERRIDLDAPIAVVGVSCRMPGGANDPDAFWELLRSGRDPMTEVPAARWDIDALYDPTPGVPGKMYTREAGFVDQDLVEGFEPEFFGISPREAESVDPQQRMLLEVAYEALERAGLATPKLYHSRTGVFVGVGSSGYHQRFQQPGGPLYVDQYAGTGALEAFVSGRVSYVLGLHGPNFALNTACSSALVSIHLACQALRTGEAEQAIAGGVHLMLSPENFVYVSQIKAVSADGRCKTFDASADGYGRAEGCGVVVLRRLDDAIRDGNPVLAVIRGTAIGHDGPSSGLTVPYGPAQVQVLSDAVARTGIDPLDVSYVEAHGTGTVLGDPIEVHAIEEVYGRGRTRDNPLHLGAVKANVGHLEVAAGAASVIKMVLALQHRELPPQIHYSEPNPDLDLDAHALVVDTAPTPWTSPRGLLRCGVSGFGLAGTNVHLVLEEAPAPTAPAARPAADRPKHLLPVTARSPESLRALSLRYADALDGLAADASGPSLADFAHVAATARIPYEHRLVVTAASAAEAARELRAYAADGSAPGVVVAEASGRPPKVAFLFSGQGAQYPGMGRELYAIWPVFRAAVDRCAAVLDELLPRPIRDVMFEDADPAGGRAPDIDDTTFTQPALFVLEYALAELWRSWGVEPAVVIGHSIGQITAACVAGVFSVEDGLRLVAERARLMGALPREGAMAAVFADEATVRAALSDVSGHGDDVGVAAINNPGETTISGRTAAVAAVVAALKAQGVESRSLTVSHAFHSPLMEPMLDAFEAAAGKIAYHPAKIPVACNLTGGLASDASLGDPRYWRDLVRNAVRFADGLKAVSEQGLDVFVEVGPHTALLAMGKRTLPTGATWLPSLQRGEPAHDRILPTLGALWTRGVAVDFRGYDAAWTRRGPASVTVPTYAWTRRRIWLELEEFPGRAASTAKWLVAPTWEPRAPQVGAVGGSWVVVGGGALADRVRAALVARGARLVGTEVVDPDDSLGGVVVVPQVTDGIGADPTGPAMTVLRAVQSLGERDAPLTIVTRGAVAVDGAELHPLAATAWGLGRVIRAERPGLRTVLIDVGGDVADNALVDAIAASEREPEVALRGSERKVARLAQVRPSGGAPELGGGAVLVTGGLGGLGLEAARWLAEHGATHLVLTGRSAPSADAEAKIAALRDSGVDVVVDRGDVAVAADVERIVTAIRARGVPLIGVVHSAGVLADASLSRLDADGFRKVYAPKVLGSWNLHQATAGDPLRFFVLFAAGAGLMGSPGQGNYAAANAFQDALAHWRRANELPAVAIDWGTWAEVGMAARAQGGTLLARQAEEGMHALPLRAGLDAMGRLLGHTGGQVGVLDVDWARLVATVHRGTVPPLLERLVTQTARAGASASAGASTPATASGLPPLLEALAGKPRPAWDGIIDGYVRGEAKKILRLPKERAIDPDVPLLDIGLDSLLAVELKNAIMDGGVDIPVARVMTGPSSRQIAQMVILAVEAKGGVEAQVQAAQTAGPSQPRAGLPAQAEDSAGPGSFATHALAFVFGITVAVIVVALYAFGTPKTALPEDGTTPAAHAAGTGDDAAATDEGGTRAAPKPTPKAAPSKAKGTKRR